MLALDDFGLVPLAEQTDLLEILDDRYDRRSTLITSQLPVDQWHDYLAELTLADAIFDRIVHNSYRLELKGESLRKRRAINTPAPPQRPVHLKPPAQPVKGGPEIYLKAIASLLRDPSITPARHTVD